MKLLILTLIADILSGGGVASVIISYGSDDTYLIFLGIILCVLGAVLHEKIYIAIKNGDL